MRSGRERRRPQDDAEQDQDDGRGQTRSQPLGEQSHLFVVGIGANQSLPNSVGPHRRHDQRTPGAG